MFLIEVTYPEGTLDAAARAGIAAEVTEGLVGTVAAPEETMQRARAMTHVAFHPAQSWTTGDGPVADQPPPYLATVTVPEAWREDIGPHAIGLVATALERHGTPAGSTRPGGDVWVNVVGVADGSIGLNGMPSTADDVVLYMTEQYRATATDVDLPDGVLVDPICGMHVRLGPHAVTLDHEGDTLGFCSRGCRAAYARQHGIEPTPV